MQFIDMLRIITITYKRVAVVVLTVVGVVGVVDAAALQWE
jgi:hypothetical protein